MQARQRSGADAEPGHCKRAVERLEARGQVDKRLLLGADVGQGKLKGELVRGNRGGDEFLLHKGCKLAVAQGAGREVDAAAWQRAVGEVVALRLEPLQHF